MVEGDAPWRICRLGIRWMERPVEGLGEWCEYFYYWKGKISFEFYIQSKTYHWVKTYFIDLILATSHKKDGESMCRAFEGMIDKAEDQYGVQLSLSLSAAIMMVGVKEEEKIWS